MLPTNYRCAPRVLDAARALIEGSLVRAQKPPLLAAAVAMGHGGGELRTVAFPDRATELDALGGEREAIDAKKELLLEQISEMEESVHALEEQIHSHSKESAIQDGRVNIARAKKKRRLDDEYEQRKKKEKAEGKSGWAAYRWKRDLLERMSIAIAKGNWALLDAHTPVRPFGAAA